MTYLIGGVYRIKSTSNGGYILQRKRGRQWKETRYFNNLADSALDLAKMKIHYDSIDLVIKTQDELDASLKRLEIIKIIDGVSQEIARAFGHENA